MATDTLLHSLTHKHCMVDKKRKLEAFSYFQKSFFLAFGAPDYRMTSLEFASSGEIKINTNSLILTHLEMMAGFDPFCFMMTTNVLAKKPFS